MKNQINGTDLPKNVLDLSLYQYHVIKAHDLKSPESIVLYNQAFHFWRSFWSKVMADNGTDDQINAYDFTRTEIVTLITYQSEIVAMHLYSILNIETDSIAYHPYFTGQEERIFFDELRKRRCRSAMPAEYLTVNEKFRKSVTGFSFAPIVSGLAYKVQRHFGVDAVLGRCRQDMKVNERMLEVGGVTLKHDVMLHNTPTDFCAVFLKDLKEHPLVEVQSKVDQLWNSRIDHTEFDANQNNVSEFSDINAA